MTHGAPQMEERAAAAHDELAVVRIDDGAGSTAIRVKFQRVVTNLEKPRLRIVAGRSQHGVTQEELPLLRRRAVGRKVFGRYAPRVSGNSFHRSSFDLNVAGFVSRP